MTADSLPFVPAEAAVGLTAARDDETLVAAVRAGDGDAFAALAARHAGWMQALAERLLARDHHLAQDVTQECLVRLHATISRDLRPLRVRPWLAVVVRNACMDEHRRRRPEPVAALPDVAVVDDDPFDVDPHLEQAWTALQPRFREVLHHRELLGLSYDEIAAAMDTSRSAVQTLLFRARAALRREYQKAGGQLLGCGAFGLSLLASFDGERVHDAGRLAAHLGRCDRCRSAVARVSELSDLVRGIPGPARHVERLAESSPGLFHGVATWMSSAFHEHLSTLSQVAQTGLIVGAIPLSAVAVLATHPAGPTVGTAARPMSPHALVTGTHQATTGASGAVRRTVDVNGPGATSPVGSSRVHPTAGPTPTGGDWSWTFFGQPHDGHHPRNRPSDGPSQPPNLVHELLHPEGHVPLPALPPLPLPG